MAKQALNLETLTLLSGSHRSRDEGVCLMEAVGAAGAAGAAIEPTVTSLQESAFDLLDRMLDVGRER